MLLISEKFWSKSMICNWQSVFKKCSDDLLVQFAEGNCTARDFESSCAEARRIVRNLGAQETRQRLKKALRRKQRCS